MGKNVTLANRLKRLEQRLPPPRMDPTPRAIRLGMVLTKPEILAFRDFILARQRGEPVQETPELLDILRRVVAVQKEVEQDSKPKKLQGEV
jgi:hypothetical protein